MIFSMESGSKAQSGRPLATVPTEYFSGMPSDLECREPSGADSEARTSLVTSRHVTPAVKGPALRSELVR
jgi:hypothetical protein